MDEKNKDGYRYSQIAVGDRYNVLRDDSGVTIFGLGRVLGKAGKKYHPTARCEVDGVTLTDRELVELRRVITLMLEKEGV